MMDVKVDIKKRINGVASVLVWMTGRQMGSR